MFDHLCVGQSIAIDPLRTEEFLQHLIDSDELCHEMAQHSRERAVSLYSYESIVKRYEELWTSTEDSPVFFFVLCRSMTNAWPTCGSFSVTQILRVSMRPWSGGVVSTKCGWPRSRNWNSKASRRLGWFPLTVKW